ncbi:MAG: LysR family transcriptional regulator [Synergistaceae bacterium]|nr:LysR family transcriptional regulator [Synergistaceae bacterium]
MRYLFEVAECQSVSRAASNLYVSQSAISHYIKYAEESLGVRLFDRSTNPISLTYAGKCYIETARKILFENEKLSREIRDITNHMTGLLRIGTSRDRASYMIPKLLPGFKKKYPGIKVEVFTESGQVLRHKLREGRIDLLILPDDGKEIPPGVCTRVIYAEELLLAAQKGVFNNKKFVRPSEIKDMPFFMQFKEHTTRSFCDSFFKENSITPQIVMEFPSNITCYRMAATGLGLAIIPFMITKLTSTEEEAELFLLGDEDNIRAWNVLAYWRKDSYIGQPELDLIQMAEKFSVSRT